MYFISNNMDKRFQMRPLMRKFWKHFGPAKLPIFLAQAAFTWDLLVTTITNGSMMTVTLIIPTCVKLASIPQTVVNNKEIFNDNS